MILNGWRRDKWSRSLRVQYGRVEDTSATGRREIPDREIVASLPCYLEENTDAQRGDGAFAQSIEALQILNRLGYGGQGSGLTLTLVYNPIGPSLPPNQATLIDAFNPATVSGLMCRNTLSVGWDGRLFDCDFNQMLNLEVGERCSSNIHQFNAASLSGNKCRADSIASAVTPTTSST